MLDNLENNLSGALATARTLELIALNEGFLKASVAHAFADLLLFAAEKKLKIERIPCWSGLSSYLELGNSKVSVFTADIPVDFESLLDACVKETAELVFLNTRQLKLTWRKAVPVPMAPGELVICFDLVSNLPEKYKEALRAAGSLSESKASVEVSEFISCHTGEDNNE